MAQANLETIDVDVHNVDEPDEDEIAQEVDDEPESESTDDDFESLKKQRKQVKTVITRLGKTISNHIDNNQTLDELSNMADEYSELVTRCQKLHERMCDAKGFNDERDDLWMTQLNTQTNAILQKIETYLQLATNPVSSISVTTKRQSSSDAQLPPSSTQTTSQSLDSTQIMNQLDKLTNDLAKEKQSRRDLQDQLQLMISQEDDRLKQMITTITSSITQQMTKLTTQSFSEFDRKHQSSLAALRSEFTEAIQTQTNQLMSSTKPFADSSVRPKQVSQKPTTTYTDDEQQPKFDIGANDDDIISSSKQSDNVVHKSVFRFPKLELKPFDGDPRKWPDFIAIFKDLVHNNATLSATEKMALLKRSLSEDIRSGLGDALSSSSLYSEALKELQSTYGHPHLVSKAYMQTLIELPKVNSNDYKSLLKVSQTINGAVSSLRDAGFNNELQSTSLLDIIVTKLPLDIQSRWGRKIVKRHPICLTLEDFAAWLHTHVKGEMMAKHITMITSSTNKNGQKTGRPQDSKPKSTINTVVVDHNSNKSPPSNQKTLTCLLCKGNHRLAQCEQFIGFDLAQRAAKIKEWSCCIKCLSRGHVMRECTTKKKCNVSECKSNHHSLLHGAPRIYETVTDKIIALHIVDDDEVTTLLLLVPVIIRCNNILIFTTALLDQGSQASIILEELTKQMKLRGTSQFTPLSTFHGQDPKLKGKRVSFVVLNRDQSLAFEVKSAYTVPYLNLQLPNVDWENIKSYWSHLSDIEPVNVTPLRIGLILGRDVLRVHDVLDTRYPPPGICAPDGILTPFEWCVTGPIPNSLLKSTKDPIHINTLATIRQQRDDILNHTVIQFWTTESFGVRPTVSNIMSADNKTALAILEKTTRHTGERYEVGLMIKREPLNLPNNKEAALRHFNQLRKRWARDPVYAAAYAKVFCEYISLGHASKVQHPEHFEPGNVWYLCHHGVTHPNKPGKIRVVFNPSAKHQGVCLNDQLHKGPDLLTSLCGVLIRFRQLPVPISGDIEKMYHQVLVPTHQRNLLRFFFQEPESLGPPSIYQMNVHIFGAVSSPTSCIYALQKTIEDFGPNYPDVAPLLMKNIYVDNYLGSAETVEDAISRRKSITVLLRHGGFNMVQWLSSSKSVLSTVDPAELSKSFDVDTGELPVERTLGMLWDCNDDTFLFNSHVRPNVKTKRQVLQEGASIFDPMGFLAPIVMSAKILLQDIWRSGATWDEDLPDDLLSTWTSWSKQLEHLSRLRIPRCIRSKEKPIKHDLHVCCDASQLGFGACVYVRVEYPGDRFDVNILMAKSRVAPLRQLSIPRLELQGAVLAIRLAHTVLTELSFHPSDVTYWCDSQTVLQWLSSRSCKYHAFVAHRVSEILDNSEPHQWRHIPGTLNPADDCSRGISPTHFTPQHRWFRGPDFLYLPSTSWPVLLHFDEPTINDPEVASSLAINYLQTSRTHPIALLIQRSSDFEKLKRIVAWLLRFNRNSRCDSSSKNLAPFLHVPEIRDALTFIIRVDQLFFFSEEIHHLKLKKPVATTSKLANLSSYLDLHGVMRVGGRLQHSSLPEDSKHPIILSSDGNLSTIIIRAVHILHLHSSVERTLHDLRHQYHVISPRTAIQRCIRQCFTCKLRNSQPVPPIMGPLPATRLMTHIPPFTNTGIDYFGPLTVVMFRRTSKRYGVLFTCLDTRAVHIEIAHSLDLESFVNAFSRFIDRRGLPKICYSDNGTNLVAGEQEINRMLSKWSTIELTNKLGRLKNQPVEWRFSPPIAPHFGGSWERLVKSAKAALRGILINRAVNDEVLATAIVGAEALLNSRPLTHVSVNPADDEALTPNHFLMLRSHPGLQLDDTPYPPVSSQKRHQLAQELITHFWNRWLREYVPNLIERRRWLRSRRNVAVNDLVLVVTPNAPRGTWPLGRISRVFTGHDGVVRSAEVKVTKALPLKKIQRPSDVHVSSSHYIRPVHKLCLLEEDVDTVFPPSETGPAMSAKT